MYAIIEDKTGKRIANANETSKHKAEGGKVLHEKLTLAEARKKLDK